jgi:GNAT superfamily N-acetyltransferase
VSVVITEARTADQLSIVTGMMLEYAKSMGDKLAESSIGKDLADGLMRYSPPKGRLLFAMTEDEEPAGIAGLSYIDDDTCELKRVYVRDILRGDGIGTALSKVALRHARWIGYRRVVLSVYRTNAAAITLYTRLGFVDVPAFKDNGINDQLRFLGIELNDSV